VPFLAGTVGASSLELLNFELKLLKEFSGSIEP